MAVCLPGTEEKKAIPTVFASVSEIGKVGPYHSDINGNTPNGGIRGPFSIEPLKTQSAPTYPVLWSHDAQRERCIEFEADSEGIIRQGEDDNESKIINAKVAKIWDLSSHCHFNTDFRFNSQSTAMQFTNKNTIGGRAWPSVKLANAAQEKALVLWANSSLGFLLHWWFANKQQAGRGSVGISALESLPVLDVTKLTEEELVKTTTIFEDLKHKELKPVNEICNDLSRREIDERLYGEILGFPREILSTDGPLALLRQKLAMEPSINGGKIPR